MRRTGTRRLAGVAALIVALAAGTLPAGAASGRTGGAPRPCRKSCAGDTTAPVVTVTSPADGARVSGVLTVAGTAADDGSVAAVEVRLGSGAFTPAAGTTSWSTSIDTRALADGQHLVEVRATDGSGNTGTGAVGVEVRNASASTGGTVLVNPVSGTDVVLLGRGRTTESNGLSVLLYQEGPSHRPWAYFSDPATGSVSHVPLPTDVTPGSDWAYATYALTSPSDLWVFSGSGPVRARHYGLTGGSLPSSATLRSSTIFGDTDSRAGDLVLLSSGALVAAWHQQGETGPQGQTVAYRSPSGTWSTVAPLRFIPTVASSQVALQHPADGSIWLFSVPDAWGAIGAAHLRETGSGLVVDWTDAMFIDVVDDGANGPDPENPDLEGVADPATGSVALAYQSDKREIFSTSPFVAGSHLAVARIRADGSRTFLTLPVYVERISAIGLSVRGGETWLGYRAVDQADLSFDDLYTSRHSGAAWDPAVRLGTLEGPYDRFAYAPGSPRFAARLADGRVHLLAG